MHPLNLFGPKTCFLVLLCRLTQKVVISLLAQNILFANQLIADSQNCDTALVRAAIF